MTNSKTPDTVELPEEVEQPSPKTAEAEQSQASSKAAVKETVLSTEDTEITPHKVRNQTAGQVLFDQGQATYQILKGQLEMTVSLHSGQNFSYSFPVDSENP